jgi:hypothetical protein
VVSMLTSGTQDRGFAPRRSRRIFSDEKILSMPSFGREVKPFAPRRRFAAGKRPLNGVKTSFQQNFEHHSRPVPLFATRSAGVVGDMEASGSESWSI